ncbi:MAG: sugar ABC transporter permease, partial [Clostridia bacterium]|nr:sugar ABC transporter permease [Clostridia bacterium]
IVFAILLNEVRSTQYKRVVQTISYFPHFIAYSVVSLILSNILSRNGLVNTILLNLGLLDTPYIFLGEAKAFWWIAVLTDVWKATGWNSIIYFSALTAIPLEQYEAATIDGANRWQKICYITLPCLKPTILMLFIMKIGSLVNGASFDLSYLLGNTLNVSRSEILSTYILDIGVSMGRFSYATALGLVESVTMLLLVLLANFIVNKASGEGLF